ncbi:hypothetical protein OROHE_008175 [Orobanche hederae]
MAPADTAGHADAESSSAATAVSAKTRLNMLGSKCSINGEQPIDALKVAKVPAGLDSSYHFYDLGLRGYTFVRLHMWNHAQSFFHLVTSLYTLEVEEAGSRCLYHILGLRTLEEEQEPYIQSISDAARERVQFMHRMTLCTRGRGRGRGGLVMVMIQSMIQPESVLSDSGHPV